MNMLDSFLQSIREQPDDDFPRLVMADWLDDNGEPERAAFIRLQCEIAQLENTCKCCGGGMIAEGYQLPVRCECGILDKQESVKHFIIEYGLNKLAGFGIPEKIKPTFHRGFVEEVIGKSENVLPWLDIACAQTVLRKVQLKTLPSIIGSGDSFGLAGDPKEMRFTMEQIRKSHLLPLRWPGIEFALPTRKPQMEEIRDQSGMVIDYIYRG